MRRLKKEQKEKQAKEEDRKTQEEHDDKSKPRMLETVQEELTMLAETYQQDPTVAPARQAATPWLARYNWRLKVEASQEQPVEKL